MRDEEAQGLLELAREGDREALGRLYGRLIRKVVIRYVEHQNYRLGYYEPEDVAQDIAVKLLENDCESLKDFKGALIGQFKGYIRRMCRNLCIDIIRRYAFERDQMVSLEAYQEEKDKEKSATLSDINQAQARTSKSVRPDALVEAELRFLELLIEQSPVDQEIMADLRLGMSHREIAEQLGIPMNTVASHIRRLRKRLKAMMAA
jgi:RNA polymerase sigma factor (sigma-70 family)